MSLNNGKRYDAVATSKNTQLQSMRYTSGERKRALGWRRRLTKGAGRAAGCSSCGSDGGGSVGEARSHSASVSITFSGLRSVCMMAHSPCMYSSPSSTCGAAQRQRWCAEVPGEGVQDFLKGGRQEKGAGPSRRIRQCRRLLSRL